MFVHCLSLCILLLSPAHTVAGCFRRCWRPSDRLSPDQRRVALSVQHATLAARAKPPLTTRRGERCRQACHSLLLGAAAYRLNPSGRSIIFCSFIFPCLCPRLALGLSEGVDLNTGKYNSKCFYPFCIRMLSCRAGLSATAGLSCTHCLYSQANFPLTIDTGWVPYHERLYDGLWRWRHHR